MSFRFPARWEGRDHGPNPLTQAVQTRKAAGLPLLDLTVSNPTVVGLPYPEDWPDLLSGRGVEGFDSGRAALRGYDPDARGMPSARRAVAEYYRERGEAVHTDDLFLTSGTSEAYAHLFKLLCEPGDAILIPRPSYPLLDTLADLAGLELASYPLIPAADVADTERPADASANTRLTPWKPDRRALSAAITPRTKVVVVVSPNNPTGNVLALEDAEWLVGFATRHGLALIVDEVFADYCHDGAASTSLVTSGDEGPLVFTLNGLSKLVGLPQLKLAWIHVAGDAHDKAVAAEALETMCDAALSVGTAPQVACAPLLRRRVEFQGPIKARLAENLATLRARVEGVHGLQVLWPERGWCVPVRCGDIEDDEAFAIRLVKEAGVLVQPGYFFDFDDEETIVVSLLAPPEIFGEGLERLIAILQADAYSRRKGAGLLDLPDSPDGATRPSGR